MDKESFVTYWPHSKAFYVGKHTDRDPGLDSQDLLGVTKKVNSSISTEYKSKALIQSAKQIKSETAVANDANLEHLQVIRLHEEIMGRPDQPFYLENASTVRNVPMLESRETWRSIGDSVLRKNRLEETKEKITKYAEIKYDVTKLSGKTLTPIEDKLRTIRDPEAIDLENLDWEFAYARNAELKDVIEKGIVRASDGTTTIKSIGNIATPASSFHSSGNVANGISTQIREFRTRNRVPIDTVIFDVVSFDKYTSNTWVGQKAGPDNVMPQHYPNGGITELPGFPGITAIIEPELDDTGNKLYFLNKANALRTAQGPTLYRRFYDETKHAEAVSVLDFVQFLSVDAELDHSKIGNRYFSFQATYTDS